MVLFVILAGTLAFGAPSSGPLESAQRMAHFTWVEHWEWGHFSASLSNWSNEGPVGPSLAANVVARDGWIKRKRIVLSQSDFADTMDNLARHGLWQLEGNQLTNGSSPPVLAVGWCYVSATDGPRRLGLLFPMRNGANHRFVDYVIHRSPIAVARKPLVMAAEERSSAVR